MSDVIGNPKDKFPCTMAHITNEKISFYIENSDISLLLENMWLDVLIRTASWSSGHFKVSAKICFGQNFV